MWVTWETSINVARERRWDSLRCSGYPPPRSTLKRRSKMKRRLMSPAHPKPLFRAREMPLPPLIWANSHASSGFSISPQQTPGYCRMELRKPWPVPQPPTTISTHRPPRSTAPRKPVWI